MLAGPISYLLASDAFDRTLADVLRENVPENFDGRKRALAQVDELMAVLRQRKEQYRKRQPGIVNLISASEMERFVRNGLTGRYDLPEATLAERRALARAEAEHFTALMADEPIGVQIGIVPDTLPHASFQIFRQPDRQHPGAVAVPAGRAAQHPRRRRDDHLGAGGAGAAREDGQGPVGARAERARRRWRSCATCWRGRTSRGGGWPARPVPAWPASAGP